MVKQITITSEGEISISKLTIAVLDASGYDTPTITAITGLSKQRISNLRNDRAFLKFDELVRVAQLLDVEIAFSVEKIDTFV
jgi:transcriptional regulator with XRE-family HTH domain